MADCSDAINALVEAVEAIERELGVTPSAVYQNVRARLDILEARINNPFAPAPDVENPFFIGDTGVTISVGDGYPSENRQPGSLYLRSDGYDNHGLYSRGADGVWWEVSQGSGGGGAPSGPAGGDLSGTYPNPTVTDLTITSEARGDILYRNATNWVRLPASTDGYVLTTHSTGADPTWAINSASPTGAAGGDLTGTYPNPTIDVNKVTLAKFQQISTDSLLGRDSASTGNVENILLNATLSMDGSGNLQRAALTGDVTAPAGSNATTIAANAVTLAKLATQSALTVLANATNGTAVPTAVAASTDGYVFARSGTSLAFIPVGTANISDSSITTVKIADNNITTVKIADANVTLAKLANITTDSLIGRDTAGTGVPEVITLNSTLVMNGSQVLGRAAISGNVTIAAGSNVASVTDLTITSQQQGSIIYYNGSNWVQLAPGSNGFVLTTHSTGADPTWSASGGGGGGGDGYGFVRKLYVPILAGNAITNSAIFASLGGLEFDRSLITAGTVTIKLQVLLETTSPLATAKLYNFTTAADVTSSTVTTSSTTPVLLTSSDLYSNLSSGSAVYQVQFSMASGSVSDQVTCSMARLILEWS